MEKVKRETLQIKGMFCGNCEKRIRAALLGLPGVRMAAVSYAEEKADVEYDADAVSAEQIRRTVEDLGYEIRFESGNHMQSISILVMIAAFYVIARHLGWTEIFNVFPTIGTTVSFGMLFVIGLLTSVHCIAMCGGINLAQSTMAAQNAGTGGKLAWRNIAYHAGRILSYTLIGAVVGGIGSVLSFQGSLRGIVAVAAGVCMIVMGSSMLGIGRNIKEKIRSKIRSKIGTKAGKNTLYFPEKLYLGVMKRFRRRTAFVIGLFNGLMPCGPLQSMQIYALSTGSAFAGALSMLMFALGTVPLMLGFGLLASALNRKYVKYMLTVSAVLIFVMGLNMVGNGLAVSGFSPLPAVSDQAENFAMIEDGIQKVTTEVDYGSYEPIIVYRGIPVEWTVIVPEGKLNGCNGEMLIPAYGVDIRLQEGENLIRFVPGETGDIPYSCWMGMIKSNIKVIES